MAASLTNVNAGATKGFGAAMIASLTATFAYGQPQSDAAAHMSVDGLKSAYIECERMASIRPLESGEIMRCSVIYEDLKARAFDGEFRKLKAWSDQLLLQPGRNDVLEVGSEASI